MMTSFLASISRHVLVSQRRHFFSSSTSKLFSLRSSLSVNDSSITVNGASFPYGWLRDSCQCPSCVHPSTSQKLHRTSDVDFDIRPISDGIRAIDAGLHVEWTTGHKSFYASAFLERHSSPSKLFQAHKDVHRILWDTSFISNTPDLFLPYKSLQTPRGLLAAVNQLSELGLLFITGVPNVEASNQTCELRTLAQKFGEIRNTFYGELWDVKNVRNARNIAYTNLDLGLHMDLLYVDHL
jgi:gamma-butyrobetaine dioxygenase